MWVLWTLIGCLRHSGKSSELHAQMSQLDIYQLCCNRDRGCEPGALHESGSGTSRHFPALRNLVAIGGHSGNLVGRRPLLGTKLTSRDVRGLVRLGGPSGRAKYFGRLPLMTRLGHRAPAMADR